MNSGTGVTLAAKQRSDILKLTVFAGLLIAAIKFFAWKITASNAILTDALESIINLIAGLFALFSVIYAARPRDENHPYGHGKVEFIAAGFEGALILIAGVSMIYRAIIQFNSPVQLHSIDIATGLTAFAGVANWFLGRFLISKGKELHSSAMQADGIHLISDTLSSIGLVLGLLIMYMTGQVIIDSLLTLVLGCYILFVGYRLIRNSLAGLMDEADFQILDEVIEVLENNRQERWIDIHNLRVVRYGPLLHIDAHLTLPWYDSLEESHEEVKKLELLINKHFGNRVEFFIHSDPCRPLSCSICTVTQCPERKHEFSQRLKWETGNLLKNKPHSSD